MRDEGKSSSLISHLYQNIKHALPFNDGRTEKTLERLNPLMQYEAPLFPLI